MMKSYLSLLDPDEAEFVEENFSTILDFTKEKIKRKHDKDSEQRPIFPEIVNLIKDQHALGGEDLRNAGSIITPDESCFVNLSHFSNMPFEVQDGIWEAALNLFVGTITSALSAIALYSS